MNFVGFPGEVIRFQLTNLQKLQPDGTYAAVVSGAVVTINVVDQATGATAAAGTVTNSNANWYADIPLPATPGFYDLRATATSGTGAGDWVGTVQVRPFHS